MRKILCFSYLERHLKKLLPIVNELNKNAEIETIVVVMSQREKDLASRNNIKSFMLDDFSSVKREKSYDTQWNDLQWGLEPLINSIITVKPDLFVCMEVNYILRNAIHYCKINKIPNVVIQHGVPNKLSLHAFAPFEGDLFLSWGKFTKDFLVLNHVDESKIYLTGGCNFDRLSKLLPNKKKYSEMIGCNPKKKWIVFTTQGLGVGDRPTRRELQEAFTETAKYATESNEFELIFQVHPSQDINQVLDILHNIKYENCYVGRWGETEELIASSDGMITFFSTTAIDCVLLGIPLMLINLEDEHNFLPFADMEAAVSVTKKEDIRFGMDCLLNPSKKMMDMQKKVAENFNYKNDGRSLERIVYQICNKLE